MSSVRFNYAVHQQLTINLKLPNARCKYLNLGYQFKSNLLTYPDKSKLCLHTELGDFLSNDSIDKPKSTDKMKTRCQVKCL